MLKPIILARWFSPCLHGKCGRAPIDKNRVLVQSGTATYTQDLGVPLPQILQTGGANYFYGHERLAAQVSGTTTWYGTDALGSVRQTLDNVGAPLASVNYDSWGLPQGNVISPFGFTGELQNAAGLTYLRARWYAPNAGSFVSLDPYEGYPTQPYSLHPYTYSHSNPVNWTDPSGKCLGWMWGDPSCQFAGTDYTRYDYAGAGQVVVTGLGVAATVVACAGTAGVACAAGAAGAAGVASWGNRALDNAGMPVAQAATQVDWRSVAVDTAIGAASGPVGYGAGRMVNPLTKRLVSGALRATVEGGIVGMTSTGSARFLNNLFDGDPNTTLTYGLLESCMIGLGIGGVSGRASYEVQQLLRRILNRTASSVTPVVHPGLGQLSGRQFRVSARDLALIEQHLSRPELDEAHLVPENMMMMQRLRAAVAAGRNITGADASFYFHELTEAGLMNKGVSYNEAHQQALDKFGVSNFSVYHPDVISELGSEQFNKNWFSFRGINR